MQPLRHPTQKTRQPPASASPAPPPSPPVLPGSGSATLPAAWNTMEKNTESRICPGSCTRPGGGKRGRGWLGCLDEYFNRKKMLKKIWHLHFFSTFAFVKQQVPNLMGATKNKHFDYLTPVLSTESIIVLCLNVTEILVRLRISHLAPWA